MAKEAIDDRGGRARGAPLEPEQGLLPRARAHEARPRRVLPRGRRRRLPAPARAPDDDEALRRRGRRRVLLPEAGARRRPPTGSRPRRCKFPSGRSADRALRQRRRPPALGGQPRGDRLQPVAGATRRPRPSRRAAGRPRPDARSRTSTRCARWRSACARCSTTTGCAATRRPRARAGSTSTSGSSRSGTSPRSAGRRWRWRARSSGASSSRPRSGGRRSATASSSTTTRTPATAPSPPPGRCARCPTLACPPRSSGTRSPTSTRPSLRLDTVPGPARRARRPVGDDRRRPPLARLAARARRPRRGRGPRRRPVAAALPQAEGRAQARAAEPGEEGLGGGGPRGRRPRLGSDLAVLPRDRAPPARPTPTTRRSPSPTRASCGWSDRRASPSSPSTTGRWSGAPTPTRTAPAPARTSPRRASWSTRRTPGEGVGRALGERVIEWATEEGFRSIQFNAVVETNDRGGRALARRSASR